MVLVYESHVIMTGYTLYREIYYLVNRSLHKVDCAM